MLRASLSAAAVEVSARRGRGECLALGHGHVALCYHTTFRDGVRHVPSLVGATFVRGFAGGIFTFRSINTPTISRVRAFSVRTVRFVVLFGTTSMFVEGEGPHHGFFVFAIAWNYPERTR